MAGELGQSSDNQAPVSNPNQVKIPNSNDVIEFPQGTSKDTAWTYLGQKYPEQFPTLAKRNELRGLLEMQKDWGKQIKNPGIGRGLAGEIGAGVAGLATGQFDTEQHNEGPPPVGPSLSDRLGRMLPDKYADTLFPWGAPAKVDSEGHDIPGTQGYETPRIGKMFVEGAKSGAIGKLSTASLPGEDPNGKPRGLIESAAEELGSLVGPLPEMAAGGRLAGVPGAFASQFAVNKVLESRMLGEGVGQSLYQGGKEGVKGAILGAATLGMGKVGGALVERAASIPADVWPSSQLALALSKSAGPKAFGELGGATLALGSSPLLQGEMPSVHSYSDAAAMLAAFHIGAAVLARHVVDNPDTKPADAVAEILKKSGAYTGDAKELAQRLSIPPANEVSPISRPQYLALPAPTTMRGTGWTVPEGPAVTGRAIGPLRRQVEVPNNALYGEIPVGPNQMATMPTRPVSGPSWLPTVQSRALDAQQRPNFTTGEPLETRPGPGQPPPQGLLPSPPPPAFPEQLTLPRPGQESPDTRLSTPAPNAATLAGTRESLPARRARLDAEFGKQVDLGMSSIGEVFKNLADFRAFQEAEDLARNPGLEERRVAELNAKAPTVPVSPEDHGKAVKAVVDEYTNGGLQLAGHSTDENGQTTVQFRQPAGTYTQRYTVTIPDKPVQGESAESSTAKSRIEELSKTPGVEIQGQTKPAKDLTTLHIKRTLDVPEDRIYSVRIGDRPADLPQSQDTVDQHLAASAVLASKGDIGAPVLESLKHQPSGLPVEERSLEEKRAFGRSVRATREEIKALKVLGIEAPDRSNTELWHQSHGTAPSDFTEHEAANEGEGSEDAGPISKRLQAAYNAMIEADNNGTRQEYLDAEQRYQQVLREESTPEESLSRITEASQKALQASTSEEAAKAGQTLAEEAGNAAQSRDSAARALARTLTGHLAAGESITDIQRASDGGIVASVRKNDGTIEQLHSVYADMALDKALEEADAHQETANQALMGALQKEAGLSGVFDRVKAAVMAELDRMKSEETGAIWNPFARAKPSDEPGRNDPQPTRKQIEDAMGETQKSVDLLRNIFGRADIDAESRKAIGMKIIEGEEMLRQLQKAALDAPVNVADPQAPLKKMDEPTLREMARGMGQEVPGDASRATILKAISEAEVAASGRTPEETLKLAQEVEGKLRAMRENFPGPVEIAKSGYNFARRQVATAFPILKELRALSDKVDESGQQVLEDAEESMTWLRKASSAGAYAAKSTEAPIYGGLGAGLKETLDNIIEMRADIVREQKGAIPTFPKEHWDAWKSNVIGIDGKTGIGAEAYLQLNARADIYFADMRKMLDELEAKNYVDPQFAANMRKYGDYSPSVFQELRDAALKGSFGRMPQGGLTALEGRTAKGPEDTSVYKVLDSKALRQEYYRNMHSIMRRADTMRNLAQVADLAPDNGWVRRIPDGTDADKIETPYRFPDPQTGEERWLAIRNDAAKGFNFQQDNELSDFFTTVRMASGVPVTKFFATGPGNPLWFVKGLPMDFLHALFATDELGNQTYKSPLPLAGAARLTADMTATAKDVAMLGRGTEGNLADDLMSRMGAMFSLQSGSSEMNTSAAIKANAMKALKGSVGEDAAQFISGAPLKAWEALTFLANREELWVRTAQYRRNLMLAADREGLDDYNDLSERDKSRAAYGVVNRLDFQDGGVFPRSMDAVALPYFNAAVQGSRAMLRTVGGDMASIKDILTGKMSPGRVLTQGEGIQTAKVVTMLMGAGAGAYALARALDPDTADNISHHTAYGLPIVLPKAFGDITVDGRKVSQVLRIPTEQWARPFTQFGWAVAQHEATGAALDPQGIVNSGLDIMNLQGWPFLPPTVRAMIAYQVNKNMSLGSQGGKLYHGIEGGKATSEIDPTTGPFAQMVGNFTGMSPARLGGAVSSVTPQGLGKNAIQGGLDDVAKLLGYPAVATPEVRTEFQHQLSGLGGDVQNVLKVALNTPGLSDAAGTLLKNARPQGDQLNTIADTQREMNTERQNMLVAKQRLIAQAKAQDGGKLTPAGVEFVAQGLENKYGGAIGKQMATEFKALVKREAATQFIDELPNGPIIRATIERAQSAPAAAELLAVQMAYGQNMDQKSILQDVAKVASTSIKNDKWWGDFTTSLRQYVPEVLAIKQKQGASSIDAARAAIGNLNRQRGLAVDPNLPNAMVPALSSR